MGSPNLITKSSPTAGSERSTEQPAEPNAQQPRDRTTQTLRIPKDVAIQHDADLLAKAAADIFGKSPVDDWFREAVVALEELKRSLGRSLSGDLEEKFLEYVKAQQENARWRKEFEDNVRKAATCDPPYVGNDSILLTVLTDLTQTALDIAGVFDPTPASDGTNALISLSRGELLDAGINAVSMIPYLGDLAKVGKLGTYPAKVARAIELALKNEKAAAVLKPLLKQLNDLILRLPLEKLPESIRAPLESVKKQLDNFFSSGEAPGRGGPYGHLKDSPSVNSGKDFTASQKQKILADNKAKNGGVLRDDKTGELLSPPQKHRKGVTPPTNEAHVDHVHPASDGGPNSFSNAEVRSRVNNLKKSNKPPEATFEDAQRLRIGVTQMPQTQFWQLGSSDSQAKLASWDDNAVDLETVICPSDEMHQRAGKRLTDLSIELPNGTVQDFVWTWYNECLIRDRVLDLFRSQGFSGLNVRPVTVRFESDRVKKPPKLWELIAAGWAGMAPPSSGVHSVDFCRICGYRVYSLPTDPAVLINPDTWDGSDFFIIWPLPGFIFVTNRVAEAIRDCKLTGAVLRRPWELQFSGDTCSPGRLSDWMPEMRAQEIGKEFGITEV